MNFINEKCSKYEKERNGKDQEIKKLKDHISEMSYDIKNLGEKVDSQEYDSQQYCLLISGFKEGVNKDTDKIAIQLIQDDLEVDVDINDLDKIHRIGSSGNSNGKLTLIIVKFTRYNVRKKVFVNKKTKRQKYQQWVECLTKLQMEKLQEVRKTHVRLNGRTYGGIIMIKSDNKIKVFYDEVIFSWQKRHQ